MVTQFEGEKKSKETTSKILKTLLSFNARLRTRSGDFILNLPSAHPSISLTVYRYFYIEGEEGGGTAKGTDEKIYFFFSPHVQ